MRQPSAMRALVSGLCLTFLAGPAAAADLQLSFPGLKPGGQVVVALFDRAAAWRAQTGAVRTAKAGVSGAAQVRFQGLAPGPYAVMAFHDRDGDGKLDTRPWGPPSEPYGFSRDARGTFGPPRWEAAVFELPAAGAAQSLRLR
jgi:uncharacterized protein (DUF2141 family)